MIPQFHGLQPPNAKNNPENAIVNAVTKESVASRFCITKEKGAGPFGRGPLGCPVRDVLEQPIEVERLILAYPGE